MIFSTCITSEGRLPPGFAAWSMVWAMPRAIVRPVSGGRILSSTSITIEALLILFIQ